MGYTFFEERTKPAERKRKEGGKCWSYYNKLTLEVSVFMILAVRGLDCGG
jgi:hypothetical protein